MKKSIILLLLPLFLFNLSCKKEPEEQPAEPIAVKEWKPEDTRSITGVNAERGLINKTDKATDGYIMFQPSASTKTVLINLDGEVVHEWGHDLNSMQAYLLDNGHLLSLQRDIDFPTFAAGGQAGRIREYDWDGNMLWDFEYATETELIHHDIEPLPNGNILAISYEVIPFEDAVAAGRDPEHTAKAGIWPDKIIEIKPTYPEGGEIVWEWRMWDHIIQDNDSTKANYGVLADNPGKININLHGEGGPPITAEQIEQMKKGSMVTSNATVDNWDSDIVHCNAVSYNADLDQIAVSSPGLGEIFIIDHSISTEEAKGPAGDLLYRWGNPANYGRENEAYPRLHGQHDVKWIPEGHPGEGELMVFNNDIPDPNSKLPNVWAAIMQAKSPDPQVAVGDVGNYSAVYQLKPPLKSDGTYELPESEPFGPKETSWTYMAPDKYSFYSAFVSGAQRLANGNTLICSGAKGRFFEVTSEGEIVWEYWNPYMDGYKLPDGTASQPTGPFLFGQFRATHFSADYSAFSGKELKAIDPQPEQFVFKMPPPPPPAEQ
ncbi:MAG: aryl-sulfate sulfotransferase [Bacteroidia bacterium]|nr:aryl-sulfate sulfotransferase [Bacteroidia bacterium]